MTQLSLDKIAATLEGLEETIISKLIDRAQFRANSVVYEPGKSGFPAADTASLFELRMRSQETMDAEFGRFCVPEERPFSRGLPDPKRRAVLPDTGLQLPDFEVINLAIDINQRYRELIPAMCRPGDDGHYGSSVEHDVYALQAIARRIHFGALYIAESKFRGDPSGYRALIEARNETALISLLTRAEVEDRIIIRVREKTAALQATANTLIRHLIDPEVIVTFYRDVVIPLTKKGEVLYLLNRRGDPS